MKGYTYSKRNKSADYQSAVVDAIMNITKPRVAQKKGVIQKHSHLGRKINKTLPRGEGLVRKMRKLGWAS